MTKLKPIAMLMLTLAVSFADCAWIDLNLRDVCTRLSKDVLKKNLEGRQVVEFAPIALIHGNTLTMGGRNKLIGALKEVINGKECSPSSLDLMTTIGSCQPGNHVALKPLTSLVAEYAAKCLTPDYLKQALIDEIETSFHLSGLSQANRLDALIDQQFVANYLAEGADKDKGNELYNITPDGSSLSSPLAKQLERDAKQQGKDSRKEFSSENAVARYMLKNIVLPCQTYAPAVGRVLEKIRESGSLIEGGSESLLSSLDQEAQTIIFRRKVCHAVPFPPEKSVIPHAVWWELSGNK